MLQALKLLLKIVVAYWLLFQLTAVLVIAPWIGHSSTFKPVVDESDLDPTWFAFFQMYSAFSNCGMRSVELDLYQKASDDVSTCSSLIDASMAPFQNAYLMIVVMCVLILGGNTGYPIL